MNTLVSISKPANEVKLSPPLADSQDITTTRFHRVRPTTQFRTRACGSVRPKILLAPDRDNRKV